MLARKSFIYQPGRQGFDANQWRAISGTPSIGDKGIVVGTGSIIHYVDFVKGDIVLNINIPTAPATGDSRVFGASTADGGAYVRFSMTDDELICQTKNGSDTDETSAIEWNNDWNNNEIEFRISWQAGAVRFFIKNVQIGIIADDSVPYGPLSLYFEDDSTLPMSIGNMAVRGTQSMTENSVSEDTDSVVFSASLSPSISPSLSPST